MRSRLFLVLMLCGTGCSSANDSPPPPVADSGTDAIVDSPSVDSEGAADAMVGDDLSSVLEPIRALHGLPSLTAAAFEGTKLLATGATGARKFGDPTKITISDKWHLGSCTKAMTATLAAMAVEDKTMAWDRTMAVAFPDFTIDPGYRDVTIEMLLMHRGGAPANVPADIWSKLWSPGVSRDQRAWAVEQMLGLVPETPPGTKFVYANAGYMMVGAALERAKSDAWESMMQKQLFDALGMTSCGFGAPATVGTIDQPWGHNLSGTTPVPVKPGPGADNPPALGPAGTVHCSLVDWAKFLAVHLAGARGEKTILPTSSFDKMHTPPTGGDYALGWGVGTRTWAGGKVLSHSGSNTMFYAVVWIAPAKNRTLVAATNIAGDEAFKGTDEAIGELVTRYVP